MNPCRSARQGIHSGFAYNPGIAGFGYGSEQRALAKFDETDRFYEVFTPWDQPNPEPKLTRLATRAGININDPADTPEESRALLRRAIGGEEAIFEDPTGHKVRITMALSDHLMLDVDGAATTARHRRQCTRFFELIPDLLESPQEIWLNFHRHESGLMTLRRKYVSHYDLGKGRILVTVGFEHGGEWLGLTFFDSKVGYLKKLRAGIELYRSN